MNKTEFKRKIGNEIYHLRTEKKYSRFQLSKKTNLSVNSLTSIENGKSIPHLYNLHLITNALDVPLHQFIKDALEDE